MATVSCPAPQRSPDAIAVVEFLERVFIPQRLAGQPRQQVNQYREAAAWLDRLFAPRSAMLADLAGDTLLRLQAFIVAQGFSASRADGVKRLLSAVAKCAWRLGILADWRPTARIAKPAKVASFRDAPPPDGSLAHVLAHVVMPRIEADRAASRRYVSVARRNSIAAAVHQFDGFLNRYSTPDDLTAANREAFCGSIAGRTSESTRRTYWRSLRNLAAILRPESPAERTTSSLRRRSRRRTSTGQPTRKVELPPPPAGSVRAFYRDVFHPERCFDTSAGHVQGIEQTLRHFFEFAGGDVPLADLDNALAARFFKWLIDVRGNSPRSVNNHRARLFAIWRMAVERGLHPAEPRVRPLRVHKSPPDAWGEEELVRILDAARRLESGGPFAVRAIGGIPAAKLWPALLLVGTQTALRGGSLVKLDVEDVDFTTGTLTVKGTAMKNRTGQRFKLGADALAALAEIREPHRKRLFPFPPGDKGRRRMSQHFRRILGIAGIPVGSAKAYKLMHKLRRSVATAIAAKLGIHAAMELLGHSSIEQTKRYIDTTKLPDRDVLAYLPTLTPPPATDKQADGNAPERTVEDPQAAAAEAERLYQAGHLTAAAMTARVAIQLHLDDLARGCNVRTENVGQQIAALAAHDVITIACRQRLKRAWECGSRAAHGRSVTALAILDLLRTAQAFVAGDEGVRHEA